MYIYIMVWKRRKENQWFLIEKFKGRFLTNVDWWDEEQGKIVNWSDYSRKKTYWTQLRIQDYSGLDMRDETRTQFLRIIMEENPVEKGQLKDPVWSRKI